MLKKLTPQDFVLIQQLPYRLQQRLTVDVT
jgi:hypothetical protein